MRRPWRPARARAPRATVSRRAGPGGPEKRSPSGLERQRPAAGAAGDVAVGHQHERGLRVLDEPLQAQPGGGRQAAARAVGPGEVERHHVEEPGAGERRRPPRSRRRALSPAALPRSACAGRAARAAARGRRPRRRPRPGSSRSSGSTSAASAPARVVCARSASSTPVRPEEAGPWISLCSPRGKPPARIGSSSAMPGRERSQPVVLAPQRRLVGLQPARPQQVFESALALRESAAVGGSGRLQGFQGGGSTAGRRGESQRSWMRFSGWARTTFAFSSLQYAARMPSASIPKTLWGSTSGHNVGLGRLPADPSGAGCCCRRGGLDRARRAAGARGTTPAPSPAAGRRGSCRRPAPRRASAASR